MLFLKTEDKGTVTLPNVLPSELAKLSRLGSEAPQEPRFGISVFHSIHCLVQMSFSSNLQFKLVLSANSTKDALRFHALGLRPTAASEANESISNEEHIFHCFEYLYDSLICGADATIEWETEAGSIDGIGIPHQCANFDALLRWTIENQPSNSAESGTHDR